MFRDMFPYQHVELHETTTFLNLFGSCWALISAPIPSGYLTYIVNSKISSLENGKSSVRYTSIIYCHGPFLSISHESPLNFPTNHHLHNHHFNHHFNLVGGLNPSEKYERQLGWLFPIYGKIENGNQTTNQICVVNPRIEPAQVITIKILAGSPTILCHASSMWPGFPALNVIVGYLDG